MTKPQSISKSLKAMSYKLKAAPGFTLVETMVAALLFGIISVIIGSVFIGLLGFQRRAGNLQEVQENTTFVIQAMAKEIRVAKVTSGDAVSPCAVSLSIQHPVNGDVTYSLDGASGLVHRVVNGVDTVISSSNVKFQKLQFCVLGSGADDKQPRITILATIVSTGGGEPAKIDYQTTLSQRSLQ